MNEFVIKAEGLTKTYGNKRAVDGVSMSVKRGDIYGFIGSNGAGKTTFLRMVMGLVKPDSGSLELFGESLPQALTRNRARIGCIIETPSLIPNMTGYDCLYAHKLLTGRKDADLGALLSTVGLADTGSKKVKDFSLGMKQRLAIAQALICNPEILILDEPTNGMDPEGIVEIRNFLKKLSANGITIVMSSHILSELEQLATRYGIIAHGQLIEEFSAAELEKKLVKSLTLRIDDPARAHEVLKHDSDKYWFLPDGRVVVKNESDFKETNKLLVKNNVYIETIHKEASDLEKYFMERVGGHGHGINS